MDKNNKKKEIIDDLVEQLKNTKLEEYKNIFEELDSDSYLLLIIVYY